MFLFVDGEVFSELLKAGNRTKFPKYLTQPWNLPDVLFSRSNCDQCPGTLVNKCWWSWYLSITAFQEAAWGRPWSLKSINLWWVGEELTICGLAKSKWRHWACAFNYLWARYDVSRFPTHISFFFPTQNTNYKFIFSCLGIEFSLFLASNVVIRTMCSYKENKVLVVFIKFAAVDITVWF